MSLFRRQKQAGVASLMVERARASKLRVLTVISLTLPFALTASCGDDFSVKSPPGPGGAAGAESGTGGDSNTGGTSNACNPECEREKPYCLSGDCVECREDDDCSEGVCEEQSHSCVECVEPADCASEGKPFCESNQCQGCAEAADCESLGLAQCGPEGTCVACLTEADCDGKVCDPDTLTCTKVQAHALNACQACMHDAECQVGQVCVEMTFAEPTPGVVGSFCLWEKATTGLGAPNGLCGTFRPYAATAEVTSVDGVATTVCQPRTTTCPGLLQHPATVTGCNAEGDDDACGAAGFADGLCRLDGDSLPKCTYPCLGNQDCKSGATCPAAGAQYCSL
jgi:hypothetical protein